LREPVDAARGPLRLIDRALHDFAGRGLVSSLEVVDLLLDMRSAVVLDAAFLAMVDEWEVRDVPATCRAR